MGAYSNSGNNNTRSYQMNEKAKSIYGNSGYYNRGSSAPVIAPSYEPEKIRRAKKEYIENKQRLVEENVRAKKNTLRDFSLGQIAVIVACLSLTLALLCTYLISMADVRSARADIASLTLEYENVAGQNVLLSNEISGQVDYDFVYDYATQVLGMQTPEKYQVITYSYEVSEYVSKRADIPNE